jgi:hypothetical protein
MVIVTEICKYIKNFKRKNFMACELYLNIAGGFFWLFFFNSRNKHYRNSRRGRDDGEGFMEKNSILNLKDKNRVISNRGDRCADRKSSVKSLVLRIDMYDAQEVGKI